MLGTHAIAAGGRRDLVYRVMKLKNPVVSIGRESESMPSLPTDEKMHLVTLQLAT